ALTAGFDGFTEVAAAVDDTHHIPPGYRAEIVLRFGDPLREYLAPWTADNSVVAEYRERFGYNNDYLAYFALPPAATDRNRGLLCVNHEFTNSRLMWPAGTTRHALAGGMDAARTAIECAALGHSVVEVVQDAPSRTWRYASVSRYNRRFTADSRVVFTGPAAGHSRMRTAIAATGAHGYGMLGLCAGGKTPWGTVLAAEENFQTFFDGHLTAREEARNHQRYGVGTECHYPWWARHQERFNLNHAPREPNHFGWIAEIDPMAPDSTPRKHTALGRFRHEAATCVVSADDRLVIYSGDDAPFEYLYKYVSTAPYRAHKGLENSGLLEEGTLYVAQFADDGTLRWLPLIHGHGPLTRQHGFDDQGDVLIETRRAADLVGGTKLDRPEDVESDPLSNVVYALLTNNPARTATDLANPRAPNPFGHILRLYPPGT
ncbi:MAG: PhoX family protein, partial [Gammaproteobacteria bacterium]